jgi:hypothetical protein
MMIRMVMQAGSMILVAVPLMMWMKTVVLMMV